MSFLLPQNSLRFAVALLARASAESVLAAFVLLVLVSVAGASRSPASATLLRAVASDETVAGSAERRVQPTGARPVCRAGKHAKAHRGRLVRRPERLVIDHTLPATRGP